MTAGRIGILELPPNAWTAGPRYIRTLVQSLRAAGGTDVVLLCRHHAHEACATGGAARIRLTPPPYVRGEWRVRRCLGLGDKSPVRHALAVHGVSVVLPLVTAEPRPRGTRALGWVPDFQHVHLPELFSADERRARTETIRRLADEMAAVIVSSRHSGDDLAAAVPRHADKIRLVPFPSRFAFEPPSGNPMPTLRRFDLPDRFVLVANQFWRHKNHALVVAAAARLRARGVAIPIVMTGLPADYRDPDNHTVSRLLQDISAAGLRDRVIVLGLVPEADLVSLLRVAAVVVQPSRFEGWSTVVQDALALGRPLLCSDIPVHREQAPGALGFFPWDAPHVLADLLATHWPALEPGPDAVREEEALRRERAFARRHGERLLALCREAA